MVVLRSSSWRSAFVQDVAAGSRFATSDTPGPHWLASGADLEHLKVRMGHESNATTSRFYLQMYEGRDAEIAERLEELADDLDSQRRLRGLP